MGLCKFEVLTGYLDNSAIGRVGRFSKPPPQLGQTLFSTLVTQSAQKVHSKVQIIASVLLLAKLLPQCSQIGQISNISLNLMV
jgi:hypothetical protein